MKSLYSSLTRRQKRFVLITIDAAALLFALWSSFALRFGELWPEERMEPFWWMFVLGPILGAYVFYRIGFYKTIIRFMGQEATIYILKGIAITSLCLYAMAQMSAIEKFPRSIPLNFAIVASLYISAVRLLVRAYYHRYVAVVSGREPVLVYGAGSAGSQLAESLTRSGKYNPVAFVDDNESLQGHLIHGLVVHAFGDVEEIIKKYEVTRVLIAIPSATKSQRRKIVTKLKPLPVKVQMLPSMAELVSDSVTYEQLREVELDDLLGREPVSPNEQLLRRSITDKVVMVTGAGGSIGSELCRQISKYQPRLLILYEMSEYALYTIEKELQESTLFKTGSAPELIAVLGSVLDKVRVSSVISRYKVQTIYHAAAYKHVPMVEHNILEGVHNNIFGTRVIAEVSQEYNVERFILISTDKAVRPTSVMGATKRFAEMLVQNIAERESSTIFSMVRFGNVLGSSGSVVPLFKRQIENGGPVTITHMDIERYFMSIPEAAQLVIQAGAMAKGGEVFVLDMGDPVKIYDLATNMIELSGLTVLDESNPEGDIEIEMKGLRPGEKLYEELVIGDNVEPTEHLQIMRAREDKVSSSVLDAALDKLQHAIDSSMPEEARNILGGVINDYDPTSPTVDHLYVK